MKTQQMPGHTTNQVSVHPLRESDLGEADRVFRLVFGTFLGLPEPLSFMGDADAVRTRWRADPGASFAADVDGELIGTSFAAKWGSFGLLGPVTVRPDLWDRGMARRLIEPSMDLFDRWGTRHVGLFTFAESPKHLALYQKFGFWPRFLTPIKSRAVHPGDQTGRRTGYSYVSRGEHITYLAAYRESTDAIYPGLDLTREIEAVAEQGLGEVVVLADDTRLEAFAVCHCGPGTEAGSGVCYVKFGAARPGPVGEKTFVRLLDACNAMAAARGRGRIVAGINTGRGAAYRAMLAQGFRVDFVGVAMERPDEVGYNRSDVYVIDDWR